MCVSTAATYFFFFVVVCVRKNQIILGTKSKKILEVLENFVAQKIKMQSPRIFLCNRNFGFNIIAFGNKKFLSWTWTF